MRWKPLPRPRLVSATANNRAQVLYYIAENLSSRAAEFAARLRAMGQSAKESSAEVDASLARIFWYAAQADKHDGASTPPSPACDSRHERAWGVMAFSVG